MTTPVAGQTHHLVLSDGTNTIGLIGANGMKSIKRDTLSAFSMKTRSGDSSYGDLEPPFASRGWNSWVGGRGQEIDEDAEQYYDSNGINTLLPHMLILNPRTYEIMATYTGFWSAIVTESALITLALSAVQIAQTFTTSPAITVTSIALRLRKTGTPSGNLTAYLYATLNGAVTGSALATSTNTLSAVDLAASFGWATFTFAGYACSAATMYAIVVGVSADSTTGNTFDFGGTTAGTYALGSCWRVVAGQSQGFSSDLFFSINSNLAAVTGDVVTGCELGGYVYLGTNPSSGAGEIHRCDGVNRIRLAYLAAASHGAAATGLTDGITAMLATNDAVLYVAQGTGTNYIRRTTDFSTWADDGTNDADLLVKWNNKVWRARAASAGAKVYKISSAPIVAWGTNLTFGTELDVGDASASITSMWVYDHRLYMTKEDASLWVLGDPDDTTVVQVYGHATQKETDNGKGATAWKVFSFIPNLYGVRRFTESSMDEVGPNRNAGMPSGRTGRIRSMAGGVNWMMCALDGDTANYSALVAFNELGWHEIFRTPSIGQRIRFVYYQGGAAGYVWFGMGARVALTHLPDTTNNPKAYAGSLYQLTGTVDLSWDDRGLPFVSKLYHSVTVLAETLTGSHTCQVYYQLDTAVDLDAWTLLGSCGLGATTLNFPVGVVGYRIRFRLSITTTDYGSSPIIRKFGYEYVERPTPNYIWQVAARLEDNVPLLSADGGVDEMTGDAVLARLDAWAAQAAGVSLYLPPSKPGATPPAAKVVVVQPAEVAYVHEDALQHHRVASFTLIEV